MELKNKVALVTGAGRRVGRALALGLAERGVSVAVHYRRSERDAESTVAEIKGKGGTARAFRANLESVGEIEKMVESVIAAFGRIDVLVNSASVFARTPIAEITEREWDLNLDTNLKAPFFLAKYAGVAMRRQGAGKIVNIGDWAGIRPFKDYLPYSVSKAAIVGLTRALARELAPEVQVNCIALGIVAPPPEYSADEVERLVSRTLTKKLGSPGDVARAVIFLCETDFATGATLTLEGGRLLV